MDDSLFKRLTALRQSLPAIGNVWPSSSSSLATSAFTAYREAPALLAGTCRADALAAGFTHEQADELLTTFSMYSSGKQTEEHMLAATLKTPPGCGGLRARPTPAGRPQAANLPYLQLGTLHPWPQLAALAQGYNADTALTGFDFAALPLWQAGASVPPYCSWEHVNMAVPVLNMLAKRLDGKGAPVWLDQAGVGVGNPSHSALTLRVFNDSAGLQTMVVGETRTQADLNIPHGMHPALLYDFPGPVAERQQLRLLCRELLNCMLVTGALLAVAATPGQHIFLCRASPELLDAVARAQHYQLPALQPQLAKARVNSRALWVSDVYTSAGRSPATVLRAYRAFTCLAQSVATCLACIPTPDSTLPAFVDTFRRATHSSVCGIDPITAQVAVDYDCCLQALAAEFAQRRLGAAPATEAGRRATLADAPPADDGQPAAFDKVATFTAANAASAVARRLVTRSPCWRVFDMQEVELLWQFAVQSDTSIWRGYVFGKSAVIKLGNLRTHPYLAAELQNEVAMYSHMSYLQGSIIPNFIAAGYLCGSLIGFIATTYEGTSAYMVDRQLTRADHLAAVNSLAAIHNHHVLHCGVHTGNFLLPRPGQEEEGQETIVWIDFGKSYIMPGLSQNHPLAREEYQTLVHEMDRVSKLKAQHSPAFGEHGGDSDGGAGSSKT